MDAIQLLAAATSLEARFRGRRLQAITGTDAAPELHFGEALSLCLSLTGPFRGLFPLKESLQEGGEAFAPYLHQRLVGFHLEAIERPWPDRVLILRFARRRLTGRYDRRALVSEFLGHRCNAALLTEEGRVDRPLYRPALTDRDARFFPGLAYTPPTRPLRSSRPEWNLLEGAPPQDFDLTGTGEGIAQRVAPVPPCLAKALGELEPSQRWDLLVQAAQALTRPSPQWYLHEESGQRFLYPFALPNWPTAVPAGPLEEAWPNYLETALHIRHAERRRQKLEGRLRRLRKRLEERSLKVAADEERHAHPESYRRYGQALASLGSGIARSDRVTATDYLATPPAAITVPVQPGRSFQEEAKRYFHRARKAERGQELAARRRFETEADLAEVAQLERDLAEADEITQEAIADRLDQLETTPAEQRHGTRKQQPEGPTPPKAYKINGHTILVGTSRASNDWLTFRRARPWDLWLHVQGLPGAHVVIPRDRKDPLPDAETLDFAASLAVSHSPKADHQAEVDWTEVKYVRRHPNGRPGQALYTHFKTRRAEALSETLGAEPSS